MFSVANDRDQIPSLLLYMIQRKYARCFLCKITFLSEISNLRRSYTVDF